MKKLRITVDGKVFDLSLIHIYGTIFSLALQSRWDEWYSTPCN